VAYFEGKVMDGPLAGQVLGQYGITHEIVVDNQGKSIDNPLDEMFKAPERSGVTIVRYQWREGAWYLRSPKWEESDATWSVARTARDGKRS
jgi:hypothetical protein